MRKSSTSRTGSGRTTTKTNKRGVVKKKTVGPGVNLKQKTKKSGQQKIKGNVKTKSTNYKVRNKGRVAGSKRK